MKLAELENNNTQTKQQDSNIQQQKVENPDNIKTLCLNGKGICIMKKLIISTEDKDNKMKILNGIYKHYIEIAQSPFGNYIIQNIFEEWDINICSDLIQACIKDALIFCDTKI